MRKENGEAKPSITGDGPDSEESVHGAHRSTDTKSDNLQEENHPGLPGKPESNGECASEQDDCLLVNKGGIPLQDLTAPVNGNLTSQSLDVDRVLDRLLAHSDSLTPEVTTHWLAPRGSTSRGVTFSARTSVVVLGSESPQHTLTPTSPRPRTYSTSSTRSIPGEGDLGVLYLLVVLYYVSLALGLMVTVPLFLLKSQFNGACLMGATVIWDASHVATAEPEAEIRDDDGKRCAFILIFSALFPVTYAMVLAVSHTVAICRGRSDLYEASSVAGCVNLLLLAVYGFVNAAVALAQLLSACLATVGFFQWCDSFSRSPHIRRSCSDLKDVRWSDPEIDGGPVYMCLFLGLVGSWLLFIVWLFQTGIVCFFWMQQAFGRSCYRRGSMSFAISSSALM